MIKKVGFIGLGRMGKWMAANVARQDFHLMVFDRDMKAMDFLIGQGAAPAGSPSDISAMADVVILSLPNTEITDDVIFGEKGLAQNARPGTAVVDCGTSGYLWTREAAGLLAEQGVLMLDAPVTGLEQKAMEAALTIMVGGPRGTLDEVKPVLKAFADTIIYMGKTGSGQLAKMINNIIYNLNIAALAEMLPVAVKLGLAPEKIANVINSGSGRSFASKFFIPKILENRFTDSYSLNNAFKDMQHMETARAELKTTLPLFRSAMDTYCKAMDLGLGDEDKGSMIKVLEGELGVMFRKGGSQSQD